MANAPSQLHNSTLAATMFVLLHPLTLSLLIPLFLYLYFHRIFGHFRGSKLPPGYFGWCPFLGDTISFITPHFCFTRGKFLDENIKRYGNIFRSHLFGYPTIVSCDAEFNSFILQNEERLFQSSYPKNIPGVLGELTLLCVTGSEHKRLRGMALELFAGMRTKDASIISDIEDNVLQVMDSWKNKDTLVFCEETRKFTFSVIVKNILSIGAEDPEKLEILRNFKTFMRGLTSFPINIPGTPYAQAIQAKWRIRKIVRNIWQRREKGKEKVKGRMDFLDVLIDGNRIPEEEVLSLVLDLLLGGYETTSMLIAIIVRFLSVNPKILSDLKEEHTMVRRSKGDQNEPIEWEDYKKMEFTRCLINEALRIGNVVKFVHRKTLKPIQFKGYHIPAGWKVIPILSGAHLDPDLHPDPFRFDPSRWQKEDTSNTKKFMPFGGGTRLCPGSEIARLEASLFLHHLVLKYAWTPLIEDEWPMSFPYIEFKHGFQLAIRPLQPSNYVTPTINL